jgi:hypothetical protein
MHVAQAGCRIAAWGASLPGQKACGMIAAKAQCKGSM